MNHHIWSVNVCLEVGLLKLHKKLDSDVGEFAAEGESYRCSTKEGGRRRASRPGSKKFVAVSVGAPTKNQPPILRNLQLRFLQWVAAARLEKDTKRYYQNGCRLLQGTKLAGVRLDKITRDAVEALRFPGSPSNANNALRSLRRMLNKAKEWHLLHEVPRFRLFKEEGRALLLDDDAERRVTSVALQPLRDIVVIMRDTGMRNARELYRLRVENVHWHSGLIFNPNSKTAKGRRFIPMSDRVVAIFKNRCAGRTEGWVFPSKRKGKHITGGLVNKQWVAARKAAGLPKDLVLYCARHDFGTYLLRRTGNLKLVMDTMGHSDIPTAMKYQHPELTIVREVLNARDREEIARRG